MEEITLKLTLNEVNTILAVFGERPFKDVFQLIGKIQTQAGGQLNLKGLPVIDMSEEEFGDALIEGRIPVGGDFGDAEIK